MDSTGEVYQVMEYISSDVIADKEKPQNLLCDFRVSQDTV
jgi:hypothetical protein